MNLVLCFRRDQFMEELENEELNLHPFPLASSREFGKNPISFQSRRYNNPNVKEIPDQYR